MILKIWLSSILVCFSVYLFITYIIALNAYNSLVEKASVLPEFIGDEQISFSGIFKSMIGGPKEILSLVFTLCILGINIIITGITVIQNKVLSATTERRYLFMLHLKHLLKCGKPVNDMEEEDL